MVFLECRFNTLVSKCLEQKRFIAPRQDVTEPTCKLHACIWVQAESHLQHRKTLWETLWMSTGLLCVCVYFVLWASAIKDRQVFNSRGIPQHCLVIVMQRRMQSLQGLGKNSVYLSWRWMADRYFSRASGGSRGKINFLIQRKDLEILFFFPNLNQY